MQPVLKKITKPIMFENLPIYKSDPILGLVEKFKNDARKDKVNLSIGIYCDESGIVPELSSIQEAKKIYNDKQKGASLYLPIDGLPSFNQAARGLVFGDHDQQIQEKVVTIQSIGGSGALSIGAQFLKKCFPNSNVYVSDPTWDNHISIFVNAGFQVYKYPYFEPELHQVDFESMYRFISSLEVESIVLLHPCCHNPTGADMEENQWDQLLELIAEKELIPFFDMAYQGLGNGLDADAYAIKKAVEMDIVFLLSQSFSKIFSLYGERCGTLSVYLPNSSTKEQVRGALKTIVRQIYSNPPAYGAHLISIILNDTYLLALWKKELVCMADRIWQMRQLLFDSLVNLGVSPTKIQYIKLQKGMFSYLGISIDNIRILREEHGIYLVENGRICIAGLNKGNVTQVADSLLGLI